MTKVLGKGYSWGTSGVGLGMGPLGFVSGDEELLKNLNQTNLQLISIAATFMITPYKHKLTGKRMVVRNWKPSSRMKQKEQVILVAKLLELRRLRQQQDLVRNSCSNNKQHLTVLSTTCRLPKKS